MTLIASLIAPLHLLDQDDQNEMQHTSFGHVMPLMLESVFHDANSISNGTIPLVRSR